MPRRRWRTRARRAPLPGALRFHLETGDYPPRDQFSNAEALCVWVTPADEQAVLWQEHGAEIVAAWIAEHPGSRPHAWWRGDATEPRRCLEGAELLKPLIGAWYWKGRFGVPAFAQCRPLGYVGCPVVESEAAYLDRLGLLAADERGRLDADDFEPVAVDPFLITAEELERMRAAGGHDRDVAWQLARDICDPRCIRA